MTDESESIARRAVRLTLRTDGERIEVIDQERLAMAVLPSTDFGDDAALSGYWHELRDSKGRALYRHIMRDPLPRYVEVPTGNPDQPLAYKSVTRPSAVFSIVVPDVPEGRVIVLLARRPESVRERRGIFARWLMRGQAVKAKEIARFKLRQDR